METSSERVFVLNQQDRILAEGRPRTYPWKTRDEELDQMSRVGDDLAGFFAEGKPSWRPR